MLAKTHNEKYDSIRKNTYALMFFGTPHAGGNRAGFAKHLANMFSVVTGEPRNNLLETLNRGSLFNETTSDDFTVQLNDYKVISYFEMRKTYVRVKNIRIFPQTSMVSESLSCAIAIPSLDSRCSL